MPDTMAWYTVRMLVPMTAVAALAVTAFSTSLGDQRAFAVSLDE